MKNIVSLLLSIIFINNFSFSQSQRIIESNSELLKIEFNFENSYKIKEEIFEGKRINYIEGKEINVRNSGEPWLPLYTINIGIPHNSKPQLQLLSSDKEYIPNIFVGATPDSINQPFHLLNYDVNIYNTNAYFPSLSAEINDYVVRYARIASLSISPYQFNPVTRELIFNKKIIIQVSFRKNPQDFIIVNKVDDKMTDDIIRSTLVNYNIAKDFVGKPVQYGDAKMQGDTYWYNPQKDYYKLFLNKKGVYRITYDYLVNAGVPAGGLQNNRLELFNNGISIPLDVVDVNNDDLFNSGDYFQFVGEPAKPADQFTRMNIYNTSNVYWFSYQADTLNYYKNINGNPTSFFPLVQSTIETLSWEEDKIFNNLGYAPNDQRDYWYWGFAETRRQITTYYFEHIIQDNFWLNFRFDKPQVKMKIGLHGVTTQNCPTGFSHNAFINFNGHTIGSRHWNGQNTALFEKDFYLSPSYIGGDTAWVDVGGNQQIIVYLSNIDCDSLVDMVFVNYIEFDYWRWNKTYPNYFYFKSPPNDFQENIYHLWDWMRDNMKIYIPERRELISNPFIANDEYKSVYFVDTVFEKTDYYCVANDYYIIPDSLVKDFPSDLRNYSNGADYIIITHPEFRSAANILEEYRSTNLSGYTNPRIKVVDVNDIYKEFSYGLLNPFALRDFAKYTFENWQQPAPAFIVLFGDASNDYRSIFPTSRKNYIPSIPFHGYEFGQLPSDNSIVLVTGNDTFPDIALGRLSCETLEEANVLVDKIINYPADNSKLWKENVILLASGLSEGDQQRLRFNHYAKLLESSYLIPNGLNSTKVFNFPEPDDIAFWGDGPRMRQEIDKGATVVSYYGHGGGAQWDLIFTKDDIPELNNGGRLPFISSITCYTAHFNNAESFGEVFTKIPNKGAIGFWGSVSLTFWPTGHSMNAKLFEHLFFNRNYVIGSAILNTFASGIAFNMIPQIAYLGDPAIELAIPKFPDFEIKSSDINISPPNPLKEDTILVSINIRNLGVTFPGDSVTVELFKNIPDPTNLIGKTKVASFGQNASINFQWIPQESGLFELIVKVNETDIIEEMDHSDNIASRSFSVFDFGQPNIIKPINGYFSENNRIDFIFSDIGFYFDRDFTYLIQINNINEFDNQVLINSDPLTPIGGIVKWQTPSLAEGEYFWRVVIYDNIDTNTSPIGIFTISNEGGSGYLAQKNLLQLFELNNINFSNEFNSLVLNTELKPPHPENKFFIDSVMFSLPPDSTEPTTFTTDGKYFYYTELLPGGVESKIYKVGTGFLGSNAGEIIEVPNISLAVYSNMFCMVGYLYTNIGYADKLLQINPENGDTISIQLSDSLLLTPDKQTQWGGYYFYYDGKYVYNLAIGNSQYPDKFILRTFNPLDNWTKIGEDVIFNGTTFPMVMSFIVVNGYMIIYENFYSAILRRYRISDGVFEEEWTYYPPFTYSRNHYTISYDYSNNYVYFGRFNPVAGTYQPGFSRYRGTYVEASGDIATQEIGPASRWYDLEFDIDQTNSNGIYRSQLLGKNQASGNWDILDSSVQPNTSLTDINVKDYNYIKLNFDLVDSSFGAGQPMKFNSLKVNYEYLPEISMIPKDMTFAPDSMLQGIDVNMNLKVHNLGYIPVDSLKLDFYMNEGDSIFFTRYVTIQPDSFIVLDNIIKTDTIIFETNIKTLATSPIQEYYTYNNLIENSFFVARDSVRPSFKITFDGKEILDEDIISAQPEVLISLKDNSPLPIQESYFTIIHNNRPLIFDGDTLNFQNSDYPNNEALVTWKPFLKDGRHVLEVLAKDASGNFFDSTSYRTTFYVYNQSDLREVYNFPNPFKDDTYFTFELRGVEVPQELKIKIFTIAGRLIRDINIPPSLLKIGFNKFHWNGRDHDGDEIANGLYFYKVIYKNDDMTKTKIQKLAKVK